MDLSLKGQPCNDETTKTLYYFGYHFDFDKVDNEGALFDSAVDGIRSKSRYIRLRPGNNNWKRLLPHLGKVENEGAFFDSMSQWK